MEVIGNFGDFIVDMASAEPPRKFVVNKLKIKVGAEHKVVDMEFKDLKEK